MSCIWLCCFSSLFFLVRRSPRFETGMCAVVMCRVPRRKFGHPKLGAHRSRNRFPDFKAASLFRGTKSTPTFPLFSVRRPLIAIPPRRVLQHTGRSLRKGAAVPKVSRDWRGFFATVPTLDSPRSVSQPWGHQLSAELPRRRIKQFAQTKL